MIGRRRNHHAAGDELVGMAHYVFPGPRAVQKRQPRPDMLRRLRLFGLFNVVAAAVVAAAFTARPVTPRPADDLTVVELFTSQGCSSCPPANANLVRLARRPEVLALSFGVTYWDQLGWPDTFAQPAFTARQRDYQRGLGNNNVWTPQMVIDGSADVVGGRMAEIEGRIAAHRALPGPVIRFSDRGVGLAGGRAPNQPADVWLVRYERRAIDVPVARGENRGRTLPHANVVRELARLGQWRGETVGFALPPARTDGLATAVLVQGQHGGVILRAGRAP